MVDWYGMRLAYDGDGDDVVDALCMCRLVHWSRYVSRLHLQEMPQVPVATDSPIQFKC